MAYRPDPDAFLSRYIGADSQADQPIPGAEATEIAQVLSGPGPSPFSGLGSPLSGSGAFSPAAASKAISAPAAAGGGLKQLIPGAVGRAVMGLGALRRGGLNSIEGAIDAAIPLLDPKLGLIDGAMRLAPGGKGLRQNWMDGTKGGTAVPPLQF